jgi:hypothetical protein
MENSHNRSPGKQTNTSDSKTAVRDEKKSKLLEKVVTKGGPAPGLTSSSISIETVAMKKIRKLPSNLSGIL